MANVRKKHGISLSLRGLVIDWPNQVWCADIPCIPLAEGFISLITVMNWFSRRVLARRLSTGMETAFCVEAWQEALDRYGSPNVLNTDQGMQFTSAAFPGVLAASGVRISMDGKGRHLDNIFIERLGRSLKYENIYIKANASVQEARRGVGGWLKFYNDERLHQALGYRTPCEVFQAPGTCGYGEQRQRVDHIPTGPSSAARKGCNRIGKGAVTWLPPRTGWGRWNWRESLLTHSDACPMNGDHLTYLSCGSREGLC